MTLESMRGHASKTTCQPYRRSANVSVRVWDQKGADRFAPSSKCRTTALSGHRSCNYTITYIGHTGSTCYHRCHPLGYIYMCICVAQMLIYIYIPKSILMFLDRLNDNVRPTNNGKELTKCRLSRISRKGGSPSTSGKSCSMARSLLSSKALSLRYAK